VNVLSPKVHDWVNVHLCFKSRKHKEERPFVYDSKERHLDITHVAHAAVVLTKHTEEWSVFCDREETHLDTTHDAHGAVVLTRQGKGDILHMSEDALSCSSNVQSFWLSSEAMPYCTCTISRVRLDWSKAADGEHHYQASLKIEERR